MKRVLLTFVSVLIGAAIWLPFLHFFFQTDPRNYRTEGSLPEATRALAARHLALWQDATLRERELAQMRASNAEWDLMGRMFFVLSLANMSCREPDRAAEYLEIMDTIIADTLRLEREKGLYHFLMPYARDMAFILKPERSLFVDGEIAIMIGARRMAEEKPDYKPLMQKRIDTIVARMKESPALLAESYPNECWIFCNTVAIAAIKLGDILDSPRHEEFINEWLAVAKEDLLDPATGLLCASYGLSGDALQGAEGSSIWMAAHCLQVADPEFARDQYARARRELGRAVLGFGYAREWPVSYVGPMDVDSGPVVPVLEISPGSSGLAIMGATAFGDTAYFQRLLTSLRFAGFPLKTDGQLRFCASNQVGDAVLLYAMVLGPLWEKALRLEETRL
jgi:hypothetical protein